MRKIFILIIALVAVTGIATANEPVCHSSEYAKLVCQTVTINGVRAQQCEWKCLPLSGAGR